MRFVWMISVLLGFGGRGCSCLERSGLRSRVIELDLGDACLLVNHG
jgi:hypothetical protein